MNDLTATAEPSFNINASRISLLLAIALGIVSLAGAWFILPYRVTEVERKLQILEASDAHQQEILIRIDENVKALKERK